MCCAHGGPFFPVCCTFLLYVASPALLAAATGSNARKLVILVGEADCQNVRGDLSKCVDTGDLPEKMRETLLEFGICVAVAVVRGGAAALRGTLYTYKYY